jgi:hypothetical protein
MTGAKRDLLSLREILIYRTVKDKFANVFDWNNVYGTNLCSV